MECSEYKRRYYTPKQNSSNTVTVTNVSNQRVGFTTGHFDFVSLFVSFATSLAHEKFSGNEQTMLVLYKHFIAIINKPDMKV